MDLGSALAMANACGFEHSGAMNVTALELLPAVRDMCAAGRCGAYGKNWCCPPGCGTLEEIRERITPYRQGVLVQSTGQMEDEFDVEAMQETEQTHKARFSRFAAQFRAACDCYPMSAGTCTICKTCAYPEPCRFPAQAMASMEACGLFVSKVCEDAGIGYYYGKNTITFTSCILF